MPITINGTNITINRNNAASITSETLNTAVVWPVGGLTTFSGLFIGNNYYGDLYLNLNNIPVGSHVAILQKVKKNRCNRHGWHGSGTWDYTKRFKSISWGSWNNQSLLGGGREATNMNRGYSAITSYSSWAWRWFGSLPTRYTKSGLVIQGNNATNSGRNGTGDKETFKDFFCLTITQTHKNTGYLNLGTRDYYGPYGARPRGWMDSSNGMTGDVSIGNEVVMGTQGREYEVVVFNSTGTEVLLCQWFCCGLIQDSPRIVAGYGKTGTITQGTAKVAGGYHQNVVPI